MNRPFSAKKPIKGVMTDDDRSNLKKCRLEVTEWILQHT